MKIVYVERMVSRYILREQKTNNGSPGYSMILNEGSHHYYTVKILWIVFRSIREIILMMETQENLSRMYRNKDVPEIKLSLI